jgi:hypothetical protein
LIVSVATRFSTSSVKNLKGMRSCLLVNLRRPARCAAIPNLP